MGGFDEQTKAMMMGALNAVDRTPGYRLLYTALVEAGDLVAGSPPPVTDENGEKVALGEGDLVAAKLAEYGIKVEDVLDLAVASGRESAAFASGVTVALCLSTVMPKNKAGWTARDEG